MYVTLPNGRKVRMPTDEEDAAIRAGIAADPDAQELDDEFFRNARPAREVLSPEMYAELTDKSRPVVISIVSDEQDRERQRRKVGRPPIAPEAQRPKVTLRLEPPILEHLRSTGKGWQTRVNALLREAVEQGRI